MAPPMRSCALAFLLASSTRALVPIADKSTGLCATEDCSGSEELAFLQFRKEMASAAAGRPGEIIATDLVAMHDLLILGYLGLMTLGPQLRDDAAERHKKCETNKQKQGFECDYMASHYNFSKPEQDFPNLLQVRHAAVDLAKLLPELHPVEACRASFNDNMLRCAEDEACDDERLVELQAAEAWACINITAAMVLPTCNGETHCPESEPPTLLTKLRDEHGALTQTYDIRSYRNFVLTEEAPPLGACKQEWNPPGYPEGNTRWLRACSIWASFHTMALRADALGGDLPNRLFGAIARLVAGGVVWCGG